MTVKFGLHKEIMKDIHWLCLTAQKCAVCDNECSNF